MGGETAAGTTPELRDCWVWWDRLNPKMPRCAFDRTDAQPHAVRYRAANWGDAVAVFVQHELGIEPPRPTNRYPVVRDADAAAVTVPGRLVAG